MGAPILSILAGPNGAGKTMLTERFKSLKLLPKTVLNLDQIPKEVYDRVTGNIYNAERDLLKQRHKFFNEQCELAIKRKIDFAYECNLRKDQIQQVKLFQDSGYKINLIYIILKSRTIKE